MNSFFLRVDFASLRSKYLMKPKFISFFMKDSNLNCSLSSVKELLIDAYAKYQDSHSSAVKDQYYWDGYIRALHHVIELGDAK